MASINFTPETFGAVVTRIRINAGLKQQYVAYKLDYSVQHITVLSAARPEPVSA